MTVTTDDDELGLAVTIFAKKVPGSRMWLQRVSGVDQIKEEDPRQGIQQRIEDARSR